jgi:hypothetical protein
VSEIKEIWKVFKMSNMQDKDMQAMFMRHATPNACIELLEELDKFNALQGLQGLNLQLEVLRTIAQKELPFNTVSVEIFINADGVSLSFKTKTSELLKKAGVSMRNINGEFI